MGKRRDLKFDKQFGGGQHRKCHLCKIKLHRDLVCLMYRPTYTNCYRTICPTCLKKMMKNISTPQDQKRSEIELAAQLI